eukprot:scaffold14699_cov170-Amphora_coffeaeformis.AAC.3
MEQSGTMNISVPQHRVQVVHTTPRSNMVIGNGSSREIVTDPNIPTNRGGIAVNTFPDALGSSRSRIPLSSPMISKRIATCHNNNNNQRRRTIFPFLPKTPEESYSGSPSGGATSGPAMGQKCSDPAPSLSPRLVCETFDDFPTTKQVAQPAVPFLPPRVGPRLLPRESTLSSHEEIPSHSSCDSNPRIASLRQDSNSFSDDDTSDACTKNVQVSVVFMPPSILRKIKRNRKVIMTSFAATNDSSSVEKVSSVESDLPSLAGSSQSESREEMRRIFPGSATNNNKLERSSTSLSSRAVAFDPRVWIREFERTPDEHEASTWYSTKELEHFKLAAVERIIAFSEIEILPTGTGRSVPKRSTYLGKALFSHQALGTDKEVKKEALFRAVLQNELRRVLVVDSHEIFLKLFVKMLSPLLPHAQIVVAAGAAEALQEAEKGRFDLILVEERLKPSSLTSAPNTTKNTSHPLPTEEESRSGSALMKRLQVKHGRALYIGVSAKLREDLPRMQSVGDICWSKPPPHMNSNLVRDLLHKLLVKRQRVQAVAELFS